MLIGYILAGGAFVVAILGLIGYFFISRRSERQKLIALRRAFSELEKKSRFALEYLSIAAHQMRTPVTSMKWELELLQKHAAKEDELEKKVKTLRLANDNLAEIVNDLLNASRVERGNFGAVRERANLEDLVEKEIALLALEAEARDIKVAVVHAASNAVAITDPLVLSEAFKNILDNAISYAPEHSEVRVYLVKKEDHYIISVHNDGAPIPPEEKEKLFAKFFRGKEAKNMRPVGTGLGLFIAKSGIESLGGMVWFESPAHDHQGSIFFISIPAKINLEEEMRPKRS